TYFYARFTGYIVAAITGMYTIGVNCQDGCNLFIGSTPLSLNVAGTDTAEVTLGYTQGGSIYLTAGVYYPITIEWAFGNSSGPELQLIWTLPQGQEGGGVTQLIPATALSDVQNSVSGRLDGSWWNGTPDLYFPSGNNSIDFSNTQHPNKNLDNIPDGPTRSLLVPSGTGKVAASAASNLTAAPANDILTADGAGNVQDSGVLVSSFLGVHGGNIAAGYALEWNSDSGISRLAAASLAIGNGTAGDFTGSLKLTTLNFSDGTSFTSSTWSQLSNAKASLTLANTAYNTTFNQTSPAIWTWANTTAATATAPIAPEHYAISTYSASTVSITINVGDTVVVRVVGTSVSDGTANVYTQVGSSQNSYATFYSLN